MVLRCGDIVVEKRLFNLCCTLRGGVMVERSPRVQEIGVRSPVATVVKTGSESSTAKRSEIGVSVTRVLGDDHYKRMPCVTEGVAR